MTQVPDIPDDKLVDLLTAEQLLDEVRDTPHMHISETLAIGISAKLAGVDLCDMVTVHLNRRS